MDIIQEYNLKSPNSDQYFRIYLYSSILLFTLDLTILQVTQNNTNYVWYAFVFHQ